MLQRAIDKRYATLEQYRLLALACISNAKDEEDLRDLLRTDSAFKADAKTMRKRRRRIDQYNDFVLQLWVQKYAAEKELARLLKWQARIDSIIHTITGGRYATRAHD